MKEINAIFSKANLTLLYQFLFCFLCIFILILPFSSQAEKDSWQARFQVRIR